MLLLVCIDGYSTSLSEMNSMDGFLGVDDELCAYDYFGAPQRKMVQRSCGLIVVVGTFPTLAFSWNARQGKRI